jgi:hypothetical protein
MQRVGSNLFNRAHNSYVEFRLIELNLGWARFEDGALTLLYKNLPPTLTRLNLSGMKNELTDEGNFLMLEIDY